MVTGTIKLGAYKELSRKPLPGDLLEGFFYGGGVANITLNCCCGKTQGQRQQSQLVNKIQQAIHPARQAPNFSDNLCAGQEAQPSARASSGFEGIPLVRIKAGGLVGYPAPHLFSNNFYDIPSSKRDARCTNIPHTGALPTVKGVGQRLRKGFQKKKNGLRERLIWKDTAYAQCPAKDAWLSRSRWLIASESLSSAAEIRHIDEEYEVMRDSPLPCLNS